LPVVLGWNALATTLPLYVVLEALPLLLPPPQAARMEAARTVSEVLSAVIEEVRMVSVDLA
jgi:hypothetical protein